MCSQHLQQSCSSRTRLFPLSGTDTEPFPCPPLILQKCDQQEPQPRALPKASATRRLCHQKQFPLTGCALHAMSPPGRFCLSDGSATEGGAGDTPTELHWGSEGAPAPRDCPSRADVTQPVATAICSQHKQVMRSSNQSGKVWRSHLC